jgi:hypothetical protein
MTTPKTAGSLVADIGLVLSESEAETLLTVPADVRGGDDKKELIGAIAPWLPSRAKP